MQTHAGKSGGADLVKAIESLPPLPAIALRVMQVAQDPKSSAADLALVVSADPGLSARVLRIANSAAYRRAREVTSVQEALVVLGFVQARNVAVSSAITAAYPEQRERVLFRIDDFWRHSLAVAMKASEFAAQGRRLDVPTTFTAGILHNIGRLAMFYSEPDGIDECVRVALETGRPLEEIERECLGYSHAELGGLLAMKWRLPSEIRDAITRNHREDQRPSVTGLVAEADELCSRNGLFAGYSLPQTEGKESETSAEWQHLIAQTDELMALIAGEPAGTLRLAS